MTVSESLRSVKGLWYDVGASWYGTVIAQYDRGEPVPHDDWHDLDDELHEIAHRTGTPKIELDPRLCLPLKIIFEDGAVEARPYCPPTEAERKAADEWLGKYKAKQKDIETIEEMLARETSAERAARIDSCRGGYADFVKRRFTNYSPGADGGKLPIPPKHMTEQLLAMTGAFPKILGKQLFADQEGTNALQHFDTPETLEAWIFHQLPPTLGAFAWGSGDQLVTRKTFFEYLKQHVEKFDHASLTPHHPPLSKTFYHPYKPTDYPSGDGSFLEGLLNFFAPATDLDRELIKAMFMTPAWGGPPGARPCFLITSLDDDESGGCGIGKSSLTKAMARLFGGAVDCDDKDGIEDLKTRLLSKEGENKCLVWLDNQKTPKISSAGLEKLITADVISGWRLYGGEGTRPNYCVVLLTVNGAGLSRDMARRSIIIRLARPEHSGTWEQDLNRYIDKNRDAIFDDLLGLLRSEGTHLTTLSTWGCWDQNVLAKVKNPAACLAEITARQGHHDEDRADAEVIREGIVAELEVRGHTPDKDVIRLSSAEAAMLYNRASGERFPVNHAIRLLKLLRIPELKPFRKNRQRGWYWRGIHAGILIDEDLQIPLRTHPKEIHYS